jgi:hypothetical protein
MRQVDEDEPRTLRLTFGPFGWELVAGAAGSRAMSTDVLVRDACLAFGDRLFWGSFSCEAPHFRQRAGEAREVTVALPKPAWVDLQLEAGRQGIELEELVEHAVMLRLQDAEDVVRRWRRRVRASQLAGGA